MCEHADTPPLERWSFNSSCGKEMRCNMRAKNVYIYVYIHAHTHTHTHIHTRGTRNALCYLVQRDTKTFDSWLIKTNWSNWIRQDELLQSVCHFLFNLSLSCMVSTRPISHHGCVWVCVCFVCEKVYVKERTFLVPLTIHMHTLTVYVRTLYLRVCRCICLIPRWFC